jgi:hypothetical protein
MQSRTSSSFGCFGVLASALFLLVSWFFLYSIGNVPARSYSLLELWVVIATFAFPMLYLLALVVGRTRLKVRIPDADPDNPFAGLVQGLRDSWSERLYAFVLLVFMLASMSSMGWSIFNHLITTLTFSQLWWWAVLATTECFLSALVGYGLGATPMEDRRRFSIVGMLAFFGLFSIPYSLYLGTHYRSLPISFWGGVPIGSIGIVLTWRYFAAGWNFTTLSWNPTRIDRYGTCGALSVVGLMVGAFLTLDIVFGNRGWMLSGLFPGSYLSSVIAAFKHGGIESKEITQ